MTTCKLVTGYIPIPNHPRTAAEYGALGERLGGCPVAKKAFYSTVESTWLHKFAAGLPGLRVSAGDNPEKNTLAYHCVNHEKVSWLKQAAAEDQTTEVFVWVDYGIFSLPGVCNQSIVEFMGKLDARHIYMPGCWGFNKVIESVSPCWRFCGSVLACPREYINVLDTAIKVIATKHVATTKNVEWEVNSWARVEAHSMLTRNKLPIRWYKADHNVSMFDNLPETT